MQVQHGEPVHGRPAQRLGASRRSRARLHQFVEHQPQQDVGIGFRGSLLRGLRGIRVCCEGDVEESRLGQGEVHVSPPGRTHPRHRPRDRFLLADRGHLGRHRAGQLAHGDLCHLGEQLLPVGEVSIGGVVGDAGLTCDLAQDHTLGAARLRQGDGRLDEGGPQIAVVVGAHGFIRGYGALSTGARILPVAISIAVASVAGALLAPRIGTKTDVTTGLVLFGLSFVWISTVTVDASYANVIVPQMVLMGLGMGLISTPATESILLVLPPARAGVGSAVNDATRELGGTLGVAVVGSVFSSVYASSLADGDFAGLPGDALARAQDSVGVAQSLSASSPALVSAVQDAFMAGLHTSSLVVGVLCLVGAVVAVLSLPGRIRAADEPSETGTVPAPRVVAVTGLSALTLR